MPPDRSILSTLSASLDLDDPTPAWHQLAAIVRWEVARGRLPVGAELPPIRSVAAAVGLHYHTVRRAWTALADEGVISQRQGRGARIVRATRVAGGWTPTGPSTDPGGQPRVWVADASIERAARLAMRLTSRWQVVAIPYPRSAAPPPPGAILMLSARNAETEWPGREGDITHIEPVLDPVTVAVARRNARIVGSDEVVLVTDPDDAVEPVRDLLRQLPRVGLRARRERSPAPIDDTAGSVLWLHLPVAWERLDWETRCRPQVLPVEFDWAPGPLAGVARRSGWEARND